MSGALRVSKEEARRFLVRRHLLAPPRSLAPHPDNVLAVVDRLAVLQFDPLEVPGARNHDLVLHARIGGYRREWCEQLLYGPDRRLFEIYNKSLNIVPINELPHYRITWARSQQRYENSILREHADVVDDILATLEAKGPLSTADFARHSHTIDWWWAPTRAARAILESLFVTGRVGVARRVGNRRYYDLIERLVPADVLARAEPEDEAMRHRLLSRYRAVGLTTPAAQAVVMYSAGDAGARRRRTAELVEQGVLVEVEVEGLKGSRYVLADERSLLEPAADARPASDAPPASDALPGVAFIAPLDPLVWDRRLLRDLFAFDYLWEVYVPEHRRRWGYYVLPILFGERFVGRIEPRLERKTRTLQIAGIWWEDEFAPRREEGFVPEVREALRAYMTFVGARRIEWSPSLGAAKRLFGQMTRAGGGIGRVAVRRSNTPLSAQRRRGPARRVAV